ncbi:MAG: hypothetical protein FWF68_08660 [Spirochaetes bacterium]|nr:hypothetical protein [Spirochaetota bacterium]
MKIVTIKDMIRKDVPIYYRKLYTGIVVIDLNNTSKEHRIDFSIEYKPTGNKEITFSFIDSVDYPLIPLSKEVKKFIDELESSGRLPD